MINIYSTIPKNDFISVFYIVFFCQMQLIINVDILNMEICKAQVART